MEAQPAQDGRMRFTLGPIERWIVSGAALLISLVLAWFGNTVLQTKDAVGDVARQQAVMADRLSIIQTQLADVPAIKLELAKQAVKIDQHDEDIKELKQLRGVR